MNGRQFNGGRLKSARVYRGLSVAELAEKLDLQRQTVSMYESNKILTPDYAIIKKLAVVLSFPIEFFLQEDYEAIDIGSVYFRSLLTTNKKYRSEQIERIKLIVKIFTFLSEYVAFYATNLPEYNGNDPEEAATLLRGFWGLSEKPIENIVYLVEKNGIIVTRFKSESNCVDAFSQRIELDDGDRYLVGYSSNKTSAARIHFDIAHELGHIMLHGWSEDIETLSRDEFREIEQQAHCFAGAFLLPRDAFLEDLGVYGNSIDYYCELKKKWKVSIAAMIRRAYNLDAISQFTYQQLMRTMQKRGIRKIEPLDDSLKTVEPSMLRVAVDVLLQKGVFTPREFVETLASEGSLSLTSKEIEQLLDLPDGELSYDNSSQDQRLHLRLIKPNKN